MSECKFPTDQSRIPFKIEAQMSVYEEIDHPDYNTHHEKGWCENSKEGHDSCIRLRGHRGNHYCYNCGESWKNTDQPKIKRRKRRTKKELLKLENEAIHRLTLEMKPEMDMLDAINDFPYEIEYDLKEIIKDVNYHATKLYKEKKLGEMLKAIKIYENKETKWKINMIKTARKLLR